MTIAARALLAELRAYGARVRTDGENLRIRGAGKLPPDLIERVRTAKPDLIRLLTFRESATPTAEAWARYFLQFPDELERLAAAAAQRGLTGEHRPTGAITTAFHWASWFAAHPDELAREVGAES